MMKYVIDGIFLTKPITGIQRYAREITKELDKIVKYKHIQMVVPEWYITDEKYDNIRIIRFGKHQGKLWEQIDLPRFLKKEKAYGIFFENTIPLLYRKGIVTIHDISLRVNSKLFCHSINDIASIFWRRIIYKCAFYSDMKIVTDSMFSKNEIKRYYHINSDNINVIYMGWQHMDYLEEDAIYFDNGKLEKNNYYFSLGVLAPNKNFKWIFNAAINNPKDIFVVAGKGSLDRYLDGKKKPHNLISLGYISDQQAKALMHYCKAFIFPSLYEGFGIPPLEAIACGAGKMILSDIPVFREVYGKNANYVNPKKYYTKLGSNMRSANSKKLLSEYSWEKSAVALYNIMYNGCS